MSEPTKKPREFVAVFIDEGYRGYSLVEPIEQEQVLPFIRNQTVKLRVREISPAYDAMVVAMAEALEFIKSFDRHDSTGKIMCESASAALALYREWKK